MKTRSLITRSLFVILVLLAGSQISFAAGTSPIPLQMDSRSTMTQRVTQTAKRVGPWKRWRANRRERAGENEYEIFATLSALMGVSGFIMLIRSFAGLITSPIIFPLAIVLLLCGLVFGVVAARHPRWKRKPLVNLLHTIALSLSMLGTFIVALSYLHIILFLF